MRGVLMTEIRAGLIAAFVAALAVTPASHATAGTLTDVSGGINLSSTTTSVPTNGLYAPSANQLEMTTSGTSALYLVTSTISSTVAPFVGIGTTSPLSGLHINEPASTATNPTAFIRIHDGSPNYGTALGLSDPGGDFVISEFNGGAAVEEFRLLRSNGNVGIGTSSPAVGLDLGSKTDALALPVGTTAQRPTAASGDIRYNSSLPAVEAYVNSEWTPLSGASSAGQLQCSGGTCNSTGSTSIAYCPYKGNVKTTASQGGYIIPSGCLTATLTSMYVGGTGSSSVAASTLYYIYLWNTSGTWVLDAETGGHATDSTTGIEIKSGDSTKTLVGMIRTDSSKKVYTGGKISFTDDINTVATWDNRVPTVTQCGFSTNRISTSSSGQTEINSENRCNFMSWGDGATFSSTQTGHLNNNAGSANTQIGRDATATNLISVTAILQPNAGQAMMLVQSSAFVPPEGFHYTVMSVQVDPGDTVTYNGDGTEKNMVYTVQ
jgi:hypothetical protein